MPPLITKHQINGMTLGVNRIGEGEPILLLHGWGGEIASIYPIAEGLAPHGFACHTLDLPGFGVSDLPPQPWQVRDYMNYVLAYLDEAGLARVHLIGHSFGGRISILLGAEHPERVGKIVLTSSAGVLPRRSLKKRLYYWGRRLIFLSLKLPLLNRWEGRVRAWFQERYGSSDYKHALAISENFGATFRNIVSQNLLPYAAQIDAPTLLIWGTNDHDTPLRDAHILEKHIPDAGLVLFEEAGHYAYLERLPQFIRIVSHFLGGS